MNPFFEELASNYNYPDSMFLNVDVDDVKVSHPLFYGNIIGGQTCVGVHQDLIQIEKDRPLLRRLQRREVVVEDEGLLGAVAEVFFKAWYPFLRLGALLIRVSLEKVLIRQRSHLGFFISGFAQEMATKKR